MARSCGGMVSRRTRSLMEEACWQRPRRIGHLLMAYQLGASIEQSSSGFERPHLCPMNAEFTEQLFFPAIRLGLLLSCSWVNN
eukprot:3159196-Amphidinium_carterae.1